MNSTRTREGNLKKLEVYSPFDDELLIRLEQDEGGPRVTFVTPAFQTQGYIWVTQGFTRWPMRGEKPVPPVDIAVGHPEFLFILSDYLHGHYGLVAKLS